jgi:hypothetical protein
MPKRPTTLRKAFAMTFLFGTMLASLACGGGGGDGGKGGAGSGGAAGGSPTGGDSGAGMGGKSAMGGMSGSGAASGPGGAAGGSSGAIAWHCAETAGSQCLCDSVIAYPQTTCPTAFSCCYSASLGGARKACVCENREESQCAALVAGTAGATRQTTCPPP